MSFNHFKAIERHSIWQSAAEQIRHLIENGTLAEQERLPGERELCQQFGISRISLREALRTLEREGYLEVRAGKGAYVRSRSDRGRAMLETWVLASQENVDKVFELRLLFEPNLAALAARKMTPEAIKKLEASVGELEANRGDPQRAIQADAAFHRILGEHTGNPLVESLVHFVMSATGAERHLTLMTPEGIDQAKRGHEEVLKCISARDSDGAADAMRRHLEDAIRYARANQALKSKGNGIGDKATSMSSRS